MAEETKTKEELVADANRWLDKGVKLEAEGKNATMVNKCLEKAVNFEDQAHSLS